MQLCISNVGNAKIQRGFKSATETPSMGSDGDMYSGASAVSANMLGVVVGAVLMALYSSF